MLNRKRMFVTTLAVLCITALIVVKAPGSSATPAPEFNLPQITGHSIKSGDLKGNIVVLDLWAAWCEPCLQEIPRFNGLAEKYKGKNVRVIGIAIASGTPDEVRAKVEEFRVKYPVLLGTDQIMSDFDVDRFPATLVLTKDWTIDRRYMDVVSNKEELIEQEINTLLAER